MPLLKKALIAWEWYRLPFNVILLAFGLFWTQSLKQKMMEEALLGYWGSVLAFGFTANVFYTLGPAAEAYLVAFRGRGFGGWRKVLFILGTAASVLMTWTFVWTMKILYVVLFHPHRQ